MMTKSLAGRLPLRTDSVALSSRPDLRAKLMSRPALPRQVVGFVPSPKRAAVAVGSLIPKLARKSFEKFGFSTACIITDWALIAGSQLASFTTPERLRWPRKPENADAAVATSDQRGRHGATLILRVEGARSLEAQYKAPQIIDRVNTYFGYRAVTDLRIIQAPMRPCDEPSHARSARPMASLDCRTTGISHPDASLPPCDRIDDQALRAALEKLGRSIILSRAQMPR